MFTLKQHYLGKWSFVMLNIFPFWCLRCKMWISLKLNMRILMRILWVQDCKSTESTVNQWISCKISGLPMKSVGLLRIQRFQTLNQGGFQPKNTSVLGLSSSKFFLTKDQWALKSKQIPWRIMDTATNINAKFILNMMEAQPAVFCKI